MQEKGKPTKKTRIFVIPTEPLEKKGKNAQKKEGIPRKGKSPQKKQGKEGQGTAFGGADLRRKPQIFA